MSNYSVSQNPIIGSSTSLAASSLLVAESFSGSSETNLIQIFNQLGALADDGKARKKRRIGDMAQYRKTALLRSYHELELWYKPPKFNELMNYICGGGEHMYHDEMKTEDIVRLLENAADFRSPSPKQVIYLFFIQCEIRKREKNCLLAERITGSIIRSMMQLTEMEQGVLVRYANLIHTPGSSSGDDFRCLIANTLLTPLYNMHRPWLSVHQRLSNAIQSCKELESNPDSIKLLSHLEPVFSQGTNAVQAWAMQLQMKLENWLSRLEMGQEVILPELYHGTKKGNEQIIPHKFLADEVKETNCGIYAGAFISTHMEKTYFSPGLAFPMEILFVPEHNIMTNMRVKTKEPYPFPINWIGLRKGIPLVLTETEFHFKRYSLAAIIVPDNRVEEQRKELPEALKDVCILENSEALLLEHYLNKDSPAFLPKFYSKKQIFKSSDVKTYQEERVPTRGTGKSLHVSTISYNPLRRDPAVVQIEKHVGYLLSPLGIFNYMKMVESNPQMARNLSLNGYFTKNIPLRVEENSKSTEAMRGRLRVRQKRMEEIYAVFPEIEESLKNPVLHAAWPDLNGKTDLFGTVQGHNPYLLLNFATIQAILFDLALECRDAFAKADDGAQFIEKLSEGDSITIHKLLVKISLLMIQRSFIGIDSPEGSSITYSFQRNGKVYFVPIDMNTFDVMEPHGRNERIKPNDPWLAAKLCKWLNKKEAEQLESCIWSLDRLQEPVANKRVELVLTLIEEMAEGMRARYFSANEQSWSALPAKFSNQPLLDVLRGLTRKEILSVSSNQSLVLATPNACDFLDPLPNDNKPAESMKSMQRIKKHFQAFNHALHASTIKNNSLWRYPEVLEGKAKSMPFEVVMNSELVPEPENVLVLTCMLVDSSLEPIKKKVIKERLLLLLDLLHVKQRVYLRQALSLINGPLGDGLRQKLYPYLYKGCSEVPYRGVQDVLDEGIAFSKKCLKDPTVHMRHCGLDHLTEKRQLAVVGEWLRFLEARQEKITKGIPVELSHWFATVKGDALVITKHLPEFGAHLILAISNAIEAFSGIVPIDGDSYSTKYFYLPKILAKHAAYICEDGSLQAKEMKAKLGFDNSTEEVSISYEAAQLESYFLNGRIPHMISKEWKFV